MSFLAKLCDEAFDNDFMERAEELQDVIYTLKEHLNIPVFEDDEEELVFIKSFFAKQEYLEDKERNDPLRIAVQNLEKSLRYL